jgi:hypothetical protein
MRDIPLLSRDRILELFHIDFETGAVTWRHRPRMDFATENAFSIWNNVFPGTEAGTRQDRGYLRVGIGGRRYLLHRLIYVAATGYNISGYEIDHIDGNTANNSIRNLRIATTAENQRNTCAHRDNPTGMRGVSWRKDRAKFHAAAKDKTGKRCFLGLFDTALGAALAHDDFVRREHGEFARPNFPDANLAMNDDPGM